MTYLIGLAATLLGLRVLHVDLAPVVGAYADAHGRALPILWALTGLAALDLSLRVRWRPAMWGLHAAALAAVWMSLVAPLGWIARTWAVLAIAYLWAAPYLATRVVLAVAYLRAARPARPTTTRASTGTRPPRTPTDPTRPAAAEAKARR